MAIKTVRVSLFGKIWVKRTLGGGKRMLEQVGTRKNVVKIVGYHNSGVGKADQVLAIQAGRHRSGLDAEAVIH